jgi:hypothetical protein
VVWRLSEASSQVLVAQHSWKHTCEGESDLLGWLGAGLKPGRAQPFAYTQHSGGGSSSGGQLQVGHVASSWEDDTVSRAAAGGRVAQSTRPVGGIRLDTETAPLNWSDCHLYLWHDRGTEHQPLKVTQESIHQA